MLVYQLLRTSKNTAVSTPTYLAQSGDGLPRLVLGAPSVRRDAELGAQLDRNLLSDLRLLAALRFVAGADQVQVGHGRPRAGQTGVCWVT